MTSRLLTLKEAKRYLAGLDPRSLHVKPHTARPLRFDRVRIDAALDAAAGPVIVPGAAPPAANDETDPDDLIAQELAELDARIAAAAGARPPARRAPGR
ncbi:MAG: hypothetical protein IPK75_01520 [Acidobacteria bacterium]|nr:hypothetical protein [Acidobacteriota bacterium]